MTKIEALELELAARKMVEGTGVGWVEVLRKKDTHKPACNKLTMFDWDNTELALGIVEGRPVWEGDKLFSLLNGREYDMGSFPNDPTRWSWNKPVPKTVMVELTVEFVKSLERCSAGVLYEACRKALGEMQ